MPSPALRRPTTNRGLGAGGSAAADGTRLPRPRPPLGSWGQAVGDAGALGYACDAVGITHLPCRGRPPNTVGGRRPGTGGKPGVTDPPERLRGPRPADTAAPIPQTAEGHAGARLVGSALEARDA